MSPTRSVATITPCSRYAHCSLGNAGLYSSVSIEKTTIPRQSAQSSTRSHKRISSPLGYFMSAFRLANISDIQSR
jgi:hypothetical protein